MLISDTFSIDSLDIIMIDGEAQRVQSMDLYPFMVAGIPDGLPVLKAYWYRRDEGTAHLLACTSQHIYQFDPPSGNWQLLFTSSVCEAWSLTTFNNQLIATNNVDLVQVWDGVEATFKPLGTALGVALPEGTYLTAARFAITFENYLIFANTIKNGLRNPYDFTWSDLGDHTNYQTGDSGEGTVSGQDAITAVYSADSQLYFFCEHSIYRVWSTGTAMVFNLAILTDKFGCQAPNSIISGYSGETLFLATDNRICLLQPGSPPQVVSEAIDPILRQIPAAEQPKVAAAACARYRCILWSIPTSDISEIPTWPPGFPGESQGNNKILCLREGVWTLLRGQVNAFSEYAPQHGYRYDSLPFGSYDAWGTIYSWGQMYSWDKYDFDLPIPATLPLLGFRSDGSIHQVLPVNTVASGESGYLVLMTDFSQGGSLNQYKRVLYLRLILRGEAQTASTITVAVSPDGISSSFTDIGTLTPNGTLNEVTCYDLPIDQRGRIFKLRISSTGTFRLIGLELYYQPSGDR
jgi:hypothetical protein